MFMDFQLISTLILLGIVAVAAIAYAFRVWISGRAHYDRVNKQGGSPLLSKGVMEGAYWFLQPVGKLLAFCHVTPNQISWPRLLSGFSQGRALRSDISVLLRRSRRFQRFWIHSTEWSRG